MARHRGYFYHPSQPLFMVGEQATVPMDAHPAPVTSSLGSGHPGGPMTLPSGAESAVGLPREARGVPEVREAGAQLSVLSRQPGG